MRWGSLNSLAGIALLALGACADVVVVDSGHRAVLMTPAGVTSVLGEGAADVPTDSVVHDFDLRQQDLAGSFAAVTADGVPLVVREPVVSYAWVADELLEADRTVGADRAPAIVAAVVGASITRVLATYRWDQLDTPRIREAQARITQLATAALRPRHLALGAVELKGLDPRLPALAEEVTATSVWEQRSATAKSGVELARQQAERQRSAASGLAAANASVAPTLTPPVLEDKANQAWQALLSSPSTTIDITEHPSHVQVDSP